MSKLVRCTKKNYPSLTRQIFYKIAFIFNVAFIFSEFGNYIYNPRRYKLEIRISQRFTDCPYCQDLVGQYFPRTNLALS